MSEMTDIYNLAEYSIVTKIQVVFYITLPKRPTDTPLRAGCWPTKPLPDVDEEDFNVFDFVTRIVLSSSFSMVERPSLDRGRRKWEKGSI